MRLAFCVFVGLAAYSLFGCGGAIAPGTDTDGGARNELASDASDGYAPLGASGRLRPHDGSILDTMHLRVVYIGSEAEGGAPNVDGFIRWLVSSESYWGILKQYGVGPGVLDGSVRLRASDFFSGALVTNGIISADDLDTLIAFRIGDGGGQIPRSTAYVFFLPVGVNVSLGDNSVRTCLDAGGYHSYDGAEPYAVLPPCDVGRSPFAIAHELSEMATDTIPGRGWFSDGDFGSAGGEIADICNHPVVVDGWLLTQLWSNADSACMPSDH